MTYEDNSEVEIELSQPFNAISAAEVLITGETQNDLIMLLYQCGLISVLNFDGKQFQEVILHKIKEPLLSKLRIYKDFIGIQHDIKKCSMYHYNKLNTELKKILIFRAKYLRLIDLQLISDLPLTFAILALSCFTLY